MRTNSDMKISEKITKLQKCWRALKIRNLVGKNGIFNVSCHPAARPTFLGGGGCV